MEIYHYKLTKIVVFIPRTLFECNRVTCVVGNVLRSGALLSLKEQMHFVSQKVKSVFDFDGFFFCPAEGVKINFG